MSPRPRTLLAVLLALVCLGAVAGAPTASARLQIGLSEQNAGVFANRLFAPLKLHYARIVVPWNIATRTDYWPGYLNSWLKGARSRRVQPHIAFGNPSYNPRFRAPTPARFWTAVKAFRKRWPQVRVFTPWNEATYKRSPTYHRPGLAADYYRVVRRLCPGCQVVAADMLDLPNLKSWLRGFLRHVGHAPRLWGIHNYRDANRNHPIQHSWTLKLTQMVRGKIWVTESGGVTGSQGANGRTAWKYSPARASASLRHLFALVGNKLVRRRYTRVYVYNFYGAWSKHKRTSGWDSGLIGLDGKPRPAYWALKGIVARNR